MNYYDVIFLDIFESIRSDWSDGIDHRGKVLIKLLPKTTLPENVRVILNKHFENMIVTWLKEDRDLFDGRSWARDCEFNYDYLKSATDWFDKAFYKEWTIVDEHSTFVM